MIEINGKNYQVRYTIRALFIFEQITGKPFKIETLLDNYLFFYSMILASNKDQVLEWDDFINAIDEDPTLFQRIADIVGEQQKKDKVFAVDDDTNEGEKKR